DVHVHALVRLGQPGGEERLQGVHGVAGGEGVVRLAPAEVQADGDGGDAEEGRFDRGGDGAGVQDVDPAVGAHVHPADDEVRAGVGAVPLLPEVGEGELGAVGGAAVDGRAGEGGGGADLAGHQRLVEGDAVAGGALHGHGGDDADGLDAPPGEGRALEGVVEGDDAGGADAVVVGEQELHEPVSVDVPRPERARKRSATAAMSPAAATTGLRIHEAYSRHSRHV